MTPSERRTACVRLLAEIDQQLRESEWLATDETLSDDDRQLVAAQLDYRRDARKRVETLLEQSNDN